MAKYVFILAVFSSLVVLGLTSTIREKRQAVPNRQQTVGGRQSFGGQTAATGQFGVSGRQAVGGQQQTVSGQQGRGGQQQSFTSNNGGYFRCTGNGQFSNPDDCSSFYDCFNGESTLAKCGDGLEFNPKKRYCDYPANVPQNVCRKTAPTHSLCLDGRTNTTGVYLVPTEKFCNAFFTCGDGWLRKSCIFCPEGSIFVARTGECHNVNGLSKDAVRNMCGGKWVLPAKYMTMYMLSDFCQLTPNPQKAVFEMVLRKMGPYQPGRQEGQGPFSQGNNANQRGGYQQNGVSQGTRTQQGTGTYQQNNNYRNNQYQQTTQGTLSQQNGYGTETRQGTGTYQQNNYGQQTNPGTQNSGRGGYGTNQGTQTSGQSAYRTNQGTYQPTNNNYRQGVYQARTINENELTTQSPNQSQTTPQEENTTEAVRNGHYGPGQYPSQG